MVDVLKIQRSVNNILDAIGEDKGRSGLIRTPIRVAKMYNDFLTNDIDIPELTVFPNEDGYDQMIVVGDITFYSLCEHHMVPFFGKAFVGYIPDKNILGLSKFARVVDYFSRRLQIQERLTKEICNFLTDKLEPFGLGVVLKAEHLCMSMRGVKKPGHLTTTSALHGVMLKAEVRDEFFKHINE